MSDECYKIKTLYKKLLTQKEYLFPAPRKRVDAPEEKGVYIIIDKSGTTVHVGRTPRAKNGIAQRLNDHLHNKSSFSREYLRRQGYRLRNGYKYKYLVVDDSRKRALLEAYTIGHLCPVHLGLSD